MTDQIGHNAGQSVAADELRNFIERVERLTEEKNNLTVDIREVYGEAKSRGFDIKAVRKIVGIRKIDQAQREEDEAMVDLYMSALGMQSSLDFETPQPVSEIVDDTQFDKHRDKVPVDKDEPKMDLPDGETGKPDAEGDVLDAETGELTSAVTTEAVSDERVHGYHCRMQRVHISKNPHEYGSDESDEWFEGWNSANETGEAPDIEHGKNIDGTFDAELTSMGDDETGPSEAETVEDAGSSGDDETADTGDIPEFLKRNEDGSLKGSDETADDTTAISIHQLGIDARKDDLDRFANPYGDETSAEYVEWLEGFDAADEQIGKLFNEGFEAASEGKGTDASGWKDDTFEHSRWMHGHDNWHKTNPQAEE